MTDKEILEKLKPLPGQLVVIERGDFVGLREAIGRDMGMENANTLSYFVDGVCIGTETEDQPTVELARKLVEVLKKSRYPARLFSVGGQEGDEVSRGEYLDDIEMFLETQSGKV